MYKEEDAKALISLITEDLKRHAHYLVADIDDERHVRNIVEFLLGGDRVVATGFTLAGTVQDAIDLERLNAVQALADRLVPLELDPVRSEEADAFYDEHWRRILAAA